MDGAEASAGVTKAQENRPLFERFGDADVRALIEGYPLAWVCGGGAGALEASLLPLIGVYDGEGRLIELIGHLMRSNPLHAALTADPRATILFSGPDAYVSPEHAGRRDWAPTWNYAQVKIGAEIAFDEALTETSLKVLIDAMEAGRAKPWSVEELGPRYRGMLTRIIGFRARVTALSGKFKLGQDEDDATLHAILGALPDAQSVAWMKRFNGGR
ncbi:FMN-binding negative transcriptional regulator [Sphingomonas koreensis]|jgi:transcriptional regulator|uniref:FMN-binding negative transcriptional regulator n=1 Tax=Sphingomonas koreensis TaxID=93064 RepID=A0A430G3F0_9SPHN|nr:FMN-binding negative transcriptional regulator [Sphingomonas koreensis]RSY84744.1 FMN-binding negative transcriptional regulator [Sphingomonas koreensis]